MEKEPKNNEEIRATLYEKEAVKHMNAAHGYEHEGNQTRADACWVLYDAKKAEIRANYPD